jgi:MarR family transcriptional regulator for hemolysin
MKPDNPDIHPDAAASPGYLANHVARRFNRLVDDVLRPHGMSMALMGPLLWLSWRGPMLQRDLVKASAIKQPAMVALLDKLEAGGFIERSPLPEHRRASVIRLTPSGEAMATTGREAFAEINARALQGLASADAQRLTTLLWDVLGNLSSPGRT